MQFISLIGMWILQLIQLTTMKSMANLQWTSSKHLACAKPFLKLMLTEILPININKDILNLILFQFKYILYEIPCEWNIQLSEGIDEQRCPVSWLTYAEL
ncbi:unnamed protein product [Schistosoma margrebowiei]|uniref:Secreted protein n=1 Tax=Schistosoma margrebowiei TaxID=48269 RepID=A0AA85AJ80_9TREM|nr:unnamed protein product [Schistosoma margrebowiei]